jgi:hypothetical protein
LHKETVGLLRGKFDGEAVRFGGGALADLSEDLEDEGTEEQLVVDAQGGEVGLDAAVGLVPLIEGAGAILPSPGRGGENKGFDGEFHDYGRTGIRRDGRVAEGIHGFLKGVFRAAP